MMNHLQLRNTANGMSYFYGILQMADARFINTGEGVLLLLITAKVYYSIVHDNLLNCNLDEIRTRQWGKNNP